MSEVTGVRASHRPYKVILCSCSGSCGEKAKAGKVGVQVLSEGPGLSHTLAAHWSALDPSRAPVSPRRAVQRDGDCDGQAPVGGAAGESSVSAL